MELVRTGTFDAAAVDGLAALADRARAADGVAPFADDLWPAVPGGTTTVALTASSGGSLVGAAYAAQQGDRLAAELVVDPDRRGRGIGGRLLAELLGAAPGELWIWSHGDHPAAAALARRHGLERARELLQLRRAVGPRAEPLPDRPLPDGVRLRPFVVGQDEAAWLAVNNAAFAWHPEQGGQTLDDIRAAEAEPGFDPAGFLMAVDDAGELLGFHWTKVHEHDPNPGVHGSTGEPIGEVYVLGVAPAAHGRGFGTALTVAGLRYLADVAGVHTVTLYVEGDNTPAVGLYERLGFHRHAVDVAYHRAELTRVGRSRRRGAASSPPAPAGRWPGTPAPR
ncbi:mycothiol synthase [Jiangella asiatica]|uniref:Mycothiol acetyltransferase n=1 Tax=Jiangella asiatica TaxID=2530372 RepID=A0A4R5CPW1_9ACTN|nr:mycothiol synthase [Jiangella asiatica]TDE01457.1 mycothiol synthase [Jiangella asiatica]